MSDSSTSNSISESLTKPSTFQQRMYDRIRESLGELLTQEEAQALVNRVIEEELFKDRQVIVGYSYNQRTEAQPSAFKEMAMEQIKPMIEEAIRQWIADNQESLKQQVNEIVEQGILKACYRALQAEFLKPTLTLQNEVTQVISKIGGLYNN